MESLARPGGNTTGFTLIEFDLCYWQIIGGAKTDRARAIYARCADIQSPINPSTGLYLRSLFNTASNMTFRFVHNTLFLFSCSAMLAMIWRHAIESHSKPRPNSGYTRSSRT